LHFVTSFVLRTLTPMADPAAPGRLLTFTQLVIEPAFALSGPFNRPSTLEGDPR